MTSRAGSEETPPAQATPVDCQVCGHALAGHDATALRFCRATQTNVLTRNCICRVT